ncbi:MAG TPA: hypothetical protein ENG41_03220 [Methanomicrobia archaeon]|nr:MAG: hypothetical protein DRN50_04665 [Thermococci archaeon]RLG00563.1 MAG: hypothetical protein DRN58_03365 [Thermococci archaeon]HDN81720.1 hypothetical protein [Methanomicrobia archaeon]
MAMSIEELKKQEEEFFKMRDEIIGEADKRGITMRILGAIAFRTKCPKYKYLEYDLGRVLTDIDFMAHYKDMRKIEDLFKDLGYEQDLALKTIMKRMGSKRMIFYNPNGIHSDVFLDELKFCHILNLKNRLEIDHPTISLSDLLLEKLQIVEINEKDIIDCIILFREHDVGDNDKETINMKYIAKLFSGDWGWWRTGTMNLGKIKHFAEKYDKLTDDDKKIVIDRIDKLMEAIEKQPKSMGWKMRNRVGDSKKWYRDVEEVER